MISIKVTGEGCTLVKPREDSKFEEISQLRALRLALESPVPVGDLISELTKINCKLDVTSTTSSVPKSVYDDIAEIACGFACESRSSSDKNTSFSIREASTDEIFGSIEFESKTSNEEKKEDTWFNVCVNKTGFSIHNAEKNSEDSKSSLRNALLSSPLVAISEDSKNAIQKPNAPLVKNLSTLLSVLGILDRV